jgi:EpsI family protein
VVDLFIGHYDRQTHGRELAGHRMRDALLRAASRIETVSTSGGDLAVMDFLTGGSGATLEHVTYWYLVSGQVVSSDYGAKLRTAWSSVVRHRTDGAVVVVRQRLHSGDSLEVARARVREFIDRLLVAS